MKKSSANPGTFSARTRRHAMVMLAWVFAWSATMVLADKAELYQWYTSPILSMAAIIINALIGLGMILTYIRHLKGMDEMQQKIQLDALALSMGVGLVGSFSYSLLVTAGFVTDVEVSDIILLMVATFVVAIIAGQVRYR